MMGEEAKKKKKNTIKDPAYLSFYCDRSGSRQWLY